MLIANYDVIGCSIGDANLYPKNTIQLTLLQWTQQNISFIFFFCFLCVLQAQSFNHNGLYVEVARQKPSTVQIYKNEVAGWHLINNYLFLDQVMNNVIYTYIPQDNVYIYLPI